jgi:hypothetical protein
MEVVESSPAIAEPVKKVGIQRFLAQQEDAPGPCRVWPSATTSVETSAADCIQIHATLIRFDMCDVSFAELRTISFPSKHCLLDRVLQALYRCPPSTHQLW